MKKHHTSQKTEPAVSCYHLTEEDVIAAFKAYFGQEASDGEYAAWSNSNRDRHDGKSMVTIRIIHPLKENNDGP